MKFIYILFVIISLSHSQHIRANVRVTAQRLTTFEKDEIKYLKNAIEIYINDYDWADTDNDDILDCQFSFIIERVTDVNGQNEYKAQILATSPAQENYYDKNISFVYSSTQELRHNDVSYNALTDLIDFYVNMIMAGELDTYSEYGGDQNYSNILETLQKAQSSRDAATWSSYRQKIYRDCVSPFSRSLRLAKLVFWDAKGLYDDGYFKDAKPRMSELLELIKNTYKNEPNNSMLKRFFDGYYKLIVEMLDPVNEMDKQHLNNLISMDPIHTNYYNKYMGKQ